MSGQIVTLEVTTRQPGKHNSRGLRREKNVPAVVYGPKMETLSFTLTEQDAVRYSKHGYENTIFTLKSSDPKLNGVQVLRKALDIHPVSRRPVHMDFHAPDMTKTVRVNVELKFVGKALGVTEGGVFSAVRRDVEIECLPTQIPSAFEVDVSGLGLDMSLHVSDVQFPEGVKLITPETDTIATCAVVEEIVVEAPTPVEGVAAEGAAAPAAGAPGAAAPAAGAPGAAAPAAGAPGAATPGAKDKK